MNLRKIYTYRYLMIPLLFIILLLNGCTLNKEEQEHKNNVIEDEEKRDEIFEIVKKQGEY